MITLVIDRTEPGRPVRATVRRSAVRAVIRRGDELLLVRSSAGDFKFPGGGREPGESGDEALIREVREECGRRVTEIGAAVVVVQERRPGIEPGVVLEMESTYVECTVSEEVGATSLDDYERELDLVAVWVGREQAHRTNESLLAGGGAHPWVAREAAVLGALGPAADRPT